MRISVDLTEEGLSKYLYTRYCMLHVCSARVFIYIPFNLTFL